MANNKHDVKVHLELDPVTDRVMRVAVHDLEKTKVVKKRDYGPVNEFMERRPDAEIRGMNARHPTDAIDLTDFAATTGELREMLEGLETVDDVKRLFLREERQSGQDVFMEEIRRRMVEGDTPVTDEEDEDE